MFINEYMKLSAVKVHPKMCIDPFENILLS